MHYMSWFGNNYKSETKPNSLVNNPDTEKTNKQRLKFIS